MHLEQEGYRRDTGPSVSPPIGRDTVSVIGKSSVESQAVCPSLLNSAAPNSPLLTASMGWESGDPPGPEWRGSGQRNPDWTAVFKKAGPLD